MSFRSISAFTLLVLANFASNVAGTDLQCVLGAGTALFNLTNSDNPNGTIIDVNSETIPLKDNTPVFFIIHGFMASPYSTRWLSLAEGLVEELDANVIAVDWRNGSCTLGGNVLTRVFAYSNAAGNVKTIGEQIAELIAKLVSDFDVELGDITVIGHSLGAHIAAFASKHLKANDVGTLTELWALDPAGPGFTANDCDTGLCLSDAEFVQIFHTSATFGLTDASGHKNFYFNGGGDQPNCPLFLPGAICSHLSAIDYLIHIIRQPDCGYIGLPWDRTTSSLLVSECTSDSCCALGPLARNYVTNGTFYVNTKTLLADCVSFASSTAASG